MPYILTTLLSLAVLAGSVFGIANYATLGQLNALSFNRPIGVSLTDITSATKISDLATILPANFNALNSAKIEVSTTTLPLLTTTLALSSVGTITTGTWSGTAIAVSKGGSGTTAPTLYMVVLGNGTAGFTYASSTGTTGQFLTSNGAGVYPSWQTSAVDTGINYTWSGRHYFTNGLIASSSAYNLIASTTAYQLNIGSLNATSTITTNNLTVTGTCINCGNGNYQNVRATQSAIYNIVTAGVYYTVPFNTETFDLANEYNNSTYLFTATSTGYYKINVKAYGSGIAGNVIQLFVYKNGLGYSTTSSEVAGGPIDINDSMNLTTGDTIQIKTLSVTNGNVNLIVTSGDAYLIIYKY